MPWSRGAGLQALRLTRLPAVAPPPRTQQTEPRVCPSLSCASSHLCSSWGHCPLLGQQGRKPARKLGERGLHPGPSREGKLEPAFWGSGVGGHSLTFFVRALEAGDQLYGLLTERRPRTDPRNPQLEEMSGVGAWCTPAHAPATAPARCLGVSAAVTAPAVLPPRGPFPALPACRRLWGGPGSDLRLSPVSPSGLQVPLSQIFRALCFQAFVSPYQNQ